MPIDVRINAFYQNGDGFLVLPGGFGTISETLQINELIKRHDTKEVIYVPAIYQAFFEMIGRLTQDNMIANEDMGNIVRLDKVETMRI